ncbi:MAG: methyltransferase [SAR202 cluster bacterium]|jgi:predicted O-methyltransferase YrrM|nr:methyltransferase [SAR202 cluster bacterium]MDP6511796.1 methyltransferase [SAR202 cluster bacterium]MDP6713745.1 methyltransferase [SAR202 cluster bacterium]
MTFEPPRPETINRLTSDTIYGLAMLAGMHLDVFTPFKDGPMTAEQVADSLNVRPDKLRPLLHALAAAGLLEIAGDQFANTPEAQRYLVDGNADSMLGMARQLADYWPELLGTAESIRTGVPQSKIDYSTASEEMLQATYDRLHPLTESLTRRLLETYDFSSFRRLADVGGGSGALAITMSEALPDLKATIIDLPSVIHFSQRYIERAGAGDRIDVLAADVVTGPLSGSFDLAMMRSFTQVLTTDQARQALKNIAQVLEPGGVIYISGDGILDDSLVSPITAIRFGLSAVNRWDEGQASTVKEHSEWLSDAGFEDFFCEALPDGASIITARKPSADS